MQECYSDDAVFSDPIFTNLNVGQLRAMWEMFCLKSNDLQINYNNVSANEDAGNAQWVATYTFSATGKKVVNNIRASFIFQNGKIIEHTDNFNFYAWAKQALGLNGLLLGWTPFVKLKVCKMALKSLTNYIDGNKY